MTLEAGKLRFTALNAIHNVTNRSAWLLWLIFINDLQVLVPFHASNVIIVHAA